MSNLITLENATVNQLAECAGYAGMDELRNSWGPAFVYGDDESPETVAKVLKHLKQYYTHVDLTDPDFIFPVKK